MYTKPSYNHITEDILLEIIVDDDICLSTSMNCTYTEWFDRHVGIDGNGFQIQSSL